MKKFCLIGKSVEGISYSKVIHSAFGLYDYDLKNVPEDNLESFIKTCEYDGFNVTYPHKKSVMKYLDEISENAKNIGAVNVVVKRKDGLFGDNTDIFGMEYAFSKNGANVKDKYCLILGSGGTSNTAEYFCKTHGAKKTAKASRYGVLNYENAYAETPDVIINTTPVGMTPDVDSYPIEISRFPSVEVVFDAIYTPSPTKLVKEAKSLGKNAFGGLDMLIYQAYKAAELFEKEVLSEDLIERAREEVIERFGL